LNNEDISKVLHAVDAHSVFWLIRKGLFQYLAGVFMKTRIYGFLDK
jgi:hypothetical protein